MPQEQGHVNIHCTYKSYSMVSLVQQVFDSHIILRSQFKSILLYNSMLTYYLQSYMSLAQKCTESWISFVTILFLFLLVDVEEQLSSETCQKNAASLTTRELITSETCRRFGASLMAELFDGAIRESLNHLNIPVLQKSDGMTLKLTNVTVCHWNVAAKA